MGMRATNFIIHGVSVDFDQLWINQEPPQITDELKQLDPDEIVNQAIIRNEDGYRISERGFNGGVGDFIVFECDSSKKATVGVLMHPVTEAYEDYFEYDTNLRPHGNDVPELMLFLRAMITGYKPAIHGTRRTFFICAQV